MEMPDLIYAAHKIYPNDSGSEWMEQNGLGRETYHHDRIVQALKRENEELKAKLAVIPAVDAGVSIINRWNAEKAQKALDEKAVALAEVSQLQAKLVGYALAVDELQIEKDELQTKLEKAKDALAYYMDISLYEGVSLGVAPINNDQGQRARTTLEEIE